MSERREAKIKMNMKTEIQSETNSIKVRNGQGYWDLKVYPWGGSFRRFKFDAELPIDRVVDWFTDGSPRQVVALLDGQPVGIQL